MCDLEVNTCTVLYGTECNQQGEGGTVLIRAVQGVRCMHALMGLMQVNVTLKSGGRERGEI